MVTIMPVMTAPQLIKWLEQEKQIMEELVRTGKMQAHHASIILAYIERLLKQVDRWAFHQLGTVLGGDPTDPRMDGDTDGKD